LWLTCSRHVRLATAIDYPTSSFGPRTEARCFTPAFGTSADACAASWHKAQQCNTSTSARRSIINKSRGKQGSTNQFESLAAAATAKWQYDELASTATLVWSTAAGWWWWWALIESSAAAARHFGPTWDFSTACPCKPTTPDVDAVGGGHITTAPSYAIQWQRLTSEAWGAAMLHEPPRSSQPNQILTRVMRCESSDGIMDRSLSGKALIVPCSSQ